MGIDVFEFFLKRLEVLAFLIIKAVLVVKTELHGYQRILHIKGIPVEVSKR